MKSYRLRDFGPAMMAAAFLTGGLSGTAAGAEPAPSVALIRQTDRIRIEIGGNLFTEYVFGDGAPKPYFHPVLAADGTRLNRDFPMAETPGEERDHPHHRSLWFAHGAVNGEDFWTETKKAGHIVLQEITEIRGGEVGVLRAKHRWLAPDGRQVCTDEVTVRVAASATDARRLDYEITLHAPAGQPLVFGDTKEGTMAFRVAKWMTMPHRLDRQEVAGVGRAVTSAGDRDAAAWGRRADWADYYAPYRGRTYGVAIFDHPQNPRHPTWWMLRDYGLFAANPFGRHDFERLADQPHIGDLVVPGGASVTFRYRFIFHQGDPDSARIADQYLAYANER